MRGGHAERWKLVNAMELSVEPKTFEGFGAGGNVRVFLM
jgi:hypothetical protein